LPSQIFLDLSCNDLGEKTSKQLKAFLACLKDPNVTSSDLSFNLLYEMTPEKSQAFFESLKTANVTLVNLSWNYLGQISPEQWQAFCDGLKDTNITSLDLSCNDLGRMTPEKWQGFFACLKDSNITSLALSGNDLGQISPEQWQAFCDGLKDTKITSLNLSGNKLEKTTHEQWQKFFAFLKATNVTSLNLSKNFLDKMTPENLQVFFDGLKSTNLTEVDLSKNNLDQLDDNKWNQLITTLKQSKINKVDFGQDTIEKLSADRKQDLANLHLTKIPLDRYQDITILQFAAKIYSLNCKIERSPEDKENKLVKSSWLVAELIYRNFFSRFNIDIIRHGILESCAPSDEIFKTPIIACKESVDLINQIYNDNPQLRTIYIAHSECFMSPKEEFLKAISVGVSEKNDGEILAFILSEQQNISTAQLKSITKIAEECNKQEIVTRIEDISKLRAGVKGHLAALTMLSDKINNNRYFSKIRFSKKLPNERISKAIAQICKKNNFVYQEDAELISLVSNNIASKDMETSVAEIACQISTRFQRSAVEEVETSHAGRVVEQRSAGSRQTEL
jgi:hypothetical protein